MIPNPASLMSNTEPLPEVEQLGVISLQTLQEYHCDNPDRRLVSLFGDVYDVTSSERSYGSDGAYKEYAGHDFTLAIAGHKTGGDWLDKFVKLTEKQHKTAKGWQDYFDTKYPKCGRLDKWENEDPETWPELTAEEQEAFDKGCIVM